MANPFPVEMPSMTPPSSGENRKSPYRVVPTRMAPMIGTGAVMPPSGRLRRQTVCPSCGSRAQSPVRPEAARTSLRAGTSSPSPLRGAWPGCSQSTMLVTPIAFSFTQTRVPFSASRAWTPPW